MNRRTYKWVSLVLTLFLLTGLSANWKTNAAPQAVTYGADARAAKGYNTVSGTVQNFDVHHISIAPAGGTNGMTDFSESVPGGCVGNCDGGHPPDGGNGIILSVSGANNTSDANASIDYINVNTGSINVVADWLMPMAEASCTANGPTASGSSSLLWLIVYNNGVEIYRNENGISQTNFVVPGLPAGLTIIANEVLPSQTATGASVTVNTLHVINAGQSDFVLGSVTVSIDCGTGSGGGPQEVPPDAGCTRTQGYYKTHESVTTSLIASMGGTLTLGCQTYSAQQVLALLSMPTKGDASLILAKQLIAAKLNVKSGAGTPNSVDTAIADADALLCQFSGKLPYNVKSSSVKGQKMTSLAGTLDQYNNGASAGGPDHCD
jgi:hypothetical protein